ncbi:phage structural protein [Burkholderia gladioli]|uniref:phage structural protein n=1 Tax=Burkholderia gladioli TaxID=28095 RepID=UPI0016416435|nr:phage protein [Burkholderia gladioli]
MATYSFMDVTATLVGPTGMITLGYGEATAEEGIVIARANDTNTMTIGSDGEGMHSLHADKSGQVTIRYLKTAPNNAKLMAMYDAQRLSSALWGKNLIEISQTASGDIITARSCAFKKPPNITYAKEGDILEWVFDVIKIDSLLGTY